MAAWAIHAGVDWDWELAAVTIWVFGLGGVALLADGSVGPGRRSTPRTLRLIAGLGCLVLALSPAALWRSQTRLEDASAAFKANECPRTVDAALDSLAAVGARAEPWELIAYCNARAGQSELAVRAAEAAVSRDPENWEFHYALALVRAANRQNPRAAAADALRLNPKQPEAADAVRAFRTNNRAAWERRARRLPLHLN
jgi:hypothetical protein